MEGTRREICRRRARELGITFRGHDKTMPDIVAGYRERHGALGHIRADERDSCRIGSGESPAGQTGR
jgi:hypothetical protein